MEPTPLSLLAKYLGITSSTDRVVTGVAIDSRQLRPGELFFALPGQRVDGHAFLEEVAAKGASGAVVREDYSGKEPLPLLRVSDVLCSLQNLARDLLAEWKIPVVAITGSLGKTTTKEFTKALLQTQYGVVASPLSYNSQATLPLSILAANATTEILVLEMGMTEKGDLKRLISIAPPDVAVVTAVAAQHTCNFPDGLEGVREEKLSILSHPKTHLALLNHAIGIPKKGPPYGTFSLKNKEADFFYEGGVVRVSGEGEIAVTLNLPLAAHAQNFLAAVAVARHFGISWKTIQEVAPTLRLPPMRFEQLEKRGILFINDAFNANPDALKAALEGVPTPKGKGRKIAVLTEMNALGIYSDQGHEEVAYEALKRVDLLLCLGQRAQAMKTIWDRAGREAEHFLDRKALSLRLKEIVQPGDVVLLKGARAYALNELLDEF